MSATALDPKANATLVQSLDRALAFHGTLRATMSKLDAAFKGWEVSPRLAAPWKHFIEGMHEHLDVEEQILFPALKAIAEGGDPVSDAFEKPLDEMQFELDELATICDALRNASPEARELEGELLDMLDQLDVHAEREQNVIFPAGVKLVEAWKAGAHKAAASPAAPSPAQSAPRPSGPQPRGPAAGKDEEHGILFRVIRRFSKLVR